MKILIALLYVASAVLPFLGAYSLWKKATATSREVKEAPAAEGVVASHARVQVLMNQGVGDALQQGDNARLDLWLIGGGLALGAAASIWSLFV